MVSIDMEKVKYEERFDGKWVLTTSRDFSSRKVALKYKELWQVERIFRDVKSLLGTRPIYHQRDENIRGHVFCSFLALVLRKELEQRLNSAGCAFEWSDIKQDLPPHTAAKLLFFFADHFLQVALSLRFLTRKPLLKTQPFCEVSSSIEFTTRKGIFINYLHVSIPEPQKRRQPGSPPGNRLQGSPPIKVQIRDIGRFLSHERPGACLRNRKWFYPELRKFHFNHAHAKFKSFVSVVEIRNYADAVVAIGAVLAAASRFEVKPNLRKFLSRRREA